MNTSTIIHRLEELIKELKKEEHKEAKKEKPEKSLKFEPHNFKIDSTGWKKKTKGGVSYLENPKGDVWEYINLKDHPELNGEQLFTWKAAIRETKKAGKRLPTDDEFKELLKTKEDMPNLVFAGFRNPYRSFYYLSSFGYFWSSLAGVSSAWYRNLHSGYATVYRYARSEANGFSVRCIDE